MKRWVKNRLKESLVRLFHVGQTFGVDVLPRHFYSEIPDVGKLKRTSSWKTPYTMVGVQGADLDEQLAFVRSVIAASHAEDALVRGNIHAEACRQNGEEGYGPIEAEFLFAFIAAQRPARIVQIGCGVSTAVCVAAAEAAGYQPHLRCIDPFPSRFLRDMADLGKIELIARPVEELEGSFWDTLGAGDLFFVDSSHALGPAGEVSRIVLEILPRLAPGVIVHFHDVYFPYDYPGNLLTTGLFFHHESVLLHAFLTGNAGMRIKASFSMLHYGRPRELQSLMPHYSPRGNDAGLTASSGHFPSATYLEVTASGRCVAT